MIRVSVLLYHVPSGVHLPMPFLHAILDRQRDVADMHEIQERLSKMDELKIAGALESVCLPFSIERHFHQQIKISATRKTI